MTTTHNALETIDLVAARQGWGRDEEPRILDRSYYRGPSGYVLTLAVDSEGRIERADLHKAGVIHKALRREDRGKLATVLAWLAMDDEDAPRQIHPAAILLLQDRLGGARASLATHRQELVRDAESVKGVSILNYAFRIMTTETRISVFEDALALALADQLDDIRALVAGIAAQEAPADQVAQRTLSARQSAARIVAGIIG